MSQTEALVIPTRVYRYAEAVERFGRLGPRLVPYLFRRDPLADAAVAELLALPAETRAAFRRAAFEHPRNPSGSALSLLITSTLEAQPWVDEERFERGSRVFDRAGLFGGLTLGLSSLVHGYASPSGNKPLAFSGLLLERADRRLAETSHFVTAVTRPGGLEPGAPGWRACLEVRLMHAEVRARIDRAGGYDRRAHGDPINQHDMLATILLFSNVFVRGLRHFGIRVSDDEADDYQHLFRRVGQLMGVEAELLPASFREAERLAEFVRATQGPPDDDARALVEALLAGPRRRAKTERERKRAELEVRVARTLCRSLIGDELAEELGLGGADPRFGALLLRRIVQTLEAARIRSERLDAWVNRVGLGYWNFMIERGLGEAPPQFHLPERLRLEGT